MNVFYFVVLFIFQTLFADNTDSLQYDSIQAQVLYDIALEPVHSNGKGVSMARTLLKLKNPILWFDYDYINFGSNKMGNSVENSIENKPNVYQVYPNPNNGNFTLYFGDETEKNIQIFNIQGLKLFETVTNKMEIQMNQEFSSGIYFVIVSSTHSTNQFKLIIND